MSLLISTICRTIEDSFNMEISGIQIAGSFEHFKRESNVYTEKWNGSLLKISLWGLESMISIVRAKDERIIFAIVPFPNQLTIVPSMLMSSTFHEADLVSKMKVIAMEYKLYRSETL